MTKLGLIFICLGLAACASSPKSPDHRNPASDGSGIGYICVKGGHEYDEAAMQNCNNLRNSIDGLQVGPVSVSGTSCAFNYRGMTQGNVTGTCGPWDVALQYIYQTSDQACSNQQVAPQPAAPPQAATGFRCFRADNSRYYVYRVPSRQLVLSYADQWMDMGYNEINTCQNELPKFGQSEDCMRADSGRYHRVNLLTGKVLDSTEYGSGYNLIDRCRTENGY